MSGAQTTEPHGKKIREVLLLSARLDLRQVCMQLFCLGNATMGPSHSEMLSLVGGYIILCCLSLRCPFWFTWVFSSQPCSGRVSFHCCGGGGGARLAMTSLATFLGRWSVVGEGFEEETPYLCSFFVSSRGVTKDQRSLSC